MSSQVLLGCLGGEVNGEEGGQDLSCVFQGDDVELGRGDEGVVMLGEDGSLGVFSS